MTWLDLVHVATWVGAVLAVAVLLGALLAVVDRALLFGWRLRARKARRKVTPMTRVHCDCRTAVAKVTLMTRIHCDPCRTAVDTDAWGLASASWITVMASGSTTTDYCSIPCALAALRQPSPISHVEQTIERAESRAVPA